MENQDQSTMKLKPSVLTGLIIVVVYIAYLVIHGRFSDIPYTEVVASADNVLNKIIIPIGIGAVALAIFGKLSGWWSNAMHGAGKLNRHKWLWIIPIIFVASIIFNLISADFSVFDSKLILYVAIGMVFVGFSEEFLFRGLLLTGLRSKISSDVWLLIISSILFGMVHGINFFQGQPLNQTLMQIGFSAVTGAYFYISYRLSGTLLVPMILHGLYDFTGFAISGGVAGSQNPISALLSLLLYPLLLVAIIMLRKPKSEPAPAANPA